MEIVWAFMNAVDRSLPSCSVSYFVISSTKINNVTVARISRS